MSIAYYKTVTIESQITDSEFVDIMEAAHISKLSDDKRSFIFLTKVGKFDIEKRYFCLESDYKNHEPPFPSNEAWELVKNQDIKINHGCYEDIEHNHVMIIKKDIIVENYTEELESMEEPYRWKRLENE